MQKPASSTAFVETLSFDDPTLANALFGPHNAHLNAIAERTGADLSTRGATLSVASDDPALRERRHDRDLPGTAIPKAYAGVPDSLYNIALVHIPQLWEQIVEAGYGDLTLAGHVHSMQLKIRPWGRGWAPAKWIYKHWSGRYDTGRTHFMSTTARDMLHIPCGWAHGPKSPCLP